MISTLRKQNQIRSIGKIFIRAFNTYKSPTPWQMLCGRQSSSRPGCYLHGAHIPTYCWTLRNHVGTLSLRVSQLKFEYFRTRSTSHCTTNLWVPKCLTFYSVALSIFLLSPLVVTQLYFYHTIFFFFFLRQKMNCLDLFFTEWSHSYLHQKEWLGYL